MNKVCLTGNLCKDTEVRKAQSGMSVASNTIAVSRDFKDKDGNYTSDFINIVIWDKAADYVATYGHKGDRAELCGRIQTRTYQNKDGVNVNVTEVLVESIKVFSRKDASKQEDKKIDTKNTLNIDDADLPF